MLSFQQNQWFHPCEFLRAAKAVHDSARTLNFMDVGMWGCKYIQLYVDQRTGSFIFRNGEGEMLTHEQVYTLFPQLRDDVKVVAAGVRPYPE